MGSAEGSSPEGSPAEDTYPAGDSPAEDSSPAEDTEDNSPAADNPAEGTYPAAAEGNRRRELHTRPAEDSPEEEAYMHSGSRLRPLPEHQPACCREN
ncbi:MAG: hypothetical protein BWZ04_02261 [Firmicutes bacterium ADurb.BinA205]|nr:MAG: hypothetical protein BWZ04_02261 [Firmicutes bacterium ADurb.BinA205]